MVYLANDIHGLNKLRQVSAIDGHDALVAYALGAVEMIANVQADILPHIGRKKVIEFFMQQIPNDACAYARSRIDEYQQS